MHGLDGEPEMSALGSFYTHAARDGVDVAELLTSWQVGGSRGGWKPFLHHISKTAPHRRRTVSLKAAKKLPQVLTPDQVQALLDACEHLRDRLLLALLYDTGDAGRGGSRVAAQRYRRR